MGTKAFGGAAASTRIKPSRRNGAAFFMFNGTLDRELTKLAELGLVKQHGGTWRISPAGLAALRKRQS